MKRFAKKKLIRGILISILALGLISIITIKILITKFDIKVENLNFSWAQTRIESLKFKNFEFKGITIDYKPAKIILFKIHLLNFDIQNVIVNTSAKLEKSGPIRIKIPQVNFSTKLLSYFLTMDKFALHKVQVKTLTIPVEVNGMFKNGKLDITSDILDKYAGEKLSFEAYDTSLNIVQESGKLTYDWKNISMVGLIDFKHLQIPKVKIKPITIEGKGHEYTIFAFLDAGRNITQTLKTTGKIGPELLSAKVTVKGLLNLTCGETSLSEAIELSCDFFTKEKMDNIMIPHLKTHISLVEKNGEYVFSIKSPKKASYLIDIDSSKALIKIPSLKNFIYAPPSFGLNGAVDINLVRENQSVSGTMNIDNFSLLNFVINKSEYKIATDTTSKEIQISGFTDDLFVLKNLVIGTTKIEGQATFDTLQINKSIHHSIFNFFQPRLKGSMKVQGDLSNPELTLDSNLQSKQFSKVHSLKVVGNKSRITFNLNGPQIISNTTLEYPRVETISSLQRFAIPGGKIDLQVNLDGIVDLSNPTIHLKALKVMVDTNAILVKASSNGINIENKNITQLNLTYAINSSRNYSISCQSTPCTFPVDLKIIHEILPEQIVKADGSIYVTLKELTVALENEGRIYIKVAKVPQVVEIHNLQGKLDFENQTASLNALLPMGEGKTKLDVNLSGNFNGDAIIDMEEAQASPLEGVISQTSGKITISVEKLIPKLIQGNIIIEETLISPNIWGLLSLGRSTEYNYSKFHPINQDRKKINLDTKLNLKISTTPGYRVYLLGNDVKIHLNQTISGNINDPIITGFVQMEGKLDLPQIGKTNLQPTRIDFDNEKILELKIPLRATLKSTISKYEVTIQLNTSLQRLNKKKSNGKEQTLKDYVENGDINLSSNPPLSSSDILSLLLFGNPGNSGEEDKSNQGSQLLVGAGSALKTTSDKNLWFIKKAKEVGIDWGINSKEVMGVNSVEHAPNIFFKTPIDIIYPRFTNLVNISAETTLSPTTFQQIGYVWQIQYAPKKEAWSRTKLNLFIESEIEPFIETEETGAGVGLFWDDKFQ